MRSAIRLFAVMIIVQFATAIGVRAMSALDLPPPFDEERYLIERYWTWLKAEVNAPPDLPWPQVDIDYLPRTVRMAFVFPTEEAPWRKMRIIVSPRSVDRAAGPERLTVVGELAHEIVHYILVLSENGWAPDTAIFQNDIAHHCDHEFMRLTLQIADFIWETYHSTDAVRSVNHMVQLACWREGHTIGDIRTR